MYLTNIVSVYCLQIMQETDRRFMSNLDKIKNLEKNLTNVSFDISIFHAGFTPWVHVTFTADFLNDQIKKTWPSLTDVVRGSHSCLYQLLNLFTQCLRGWSVLIRFWP